MTQQPSSVPAGWYPNPVNASEIRYWDGNAWTVHVMPKDSPPPSPSLTSQAPVVPVTGPSAQAVGGHPDYAVPIMTGDIHPFSCYAPAVVASVVLGSFSVPTALVGLFAGLFEGDSSGLGAGLLILFIYALSIAPFYVLGYLRLKNLSVQLTSRTVDVNSGIVSKASSSLQIAKFESSGMVRSLFGRMLGYAQITCVGTGGSQETLPAIRNFDAFSEALRQQIELNRQR